LGGKIKINVVELAGHVAWLRQKRNALRTLGIDDGIILKCALRTRMEGLGQD
jgi:hypothetical protein